MGIFGTSSPFDTDIEKATSEMNTEEDWGLILEICDKVGRTSTGPKDCLRSIVKRLNHKVPHVALQALTVLDSCVQNCGKIFHLEMCTRDFTNEYKQLMAKAHQKVADKMKEMLKKWAEGEFKKDSALHLIPSLYNELRRDGLMFGTGSPTTDSASSSSVKSSSAAPSSKEEDDLAKAIALSLKESKSSQPKTSTNLYPSVTGPSSIYPTIVAPVSDSVYVAGKDLRKVRAIYDFEAAEDNELTFKAGELISILDDSDPNWWKGTNFRGEGLFPANFVTADLSEEPEKKKVHFNEEVEIKTVEPIPEVLEIDESKIDECLNLLQNADPTGETRPDTAEMVSLEGQCKAMGPLIDQELEQVDREHNMLMELNKSVIDALQMYDTLMKEPMPLYTQPSIPQYAQPPMSQQMPSQTGYVSPRNSYIPPPAQGQMSYGVSQLPNANMGNQIPPQTVADARDPQQRFSPVPQRFSPVPTSQPQYMGSVPVSQPVSSYGPPPTTAYSAAPIPSDNMNNSAIPTQYQTYSMNSMPPTMTQPMYQQPEQLLQ